MENINFNFEKFVKDLEKKSSAELERKKALHEKQKAWTARRRLNRLYMENHHNRMRVERK